MITILYLCLRIAKMQRSSGTKPSSWSKNEVLNPSGLGLIWLFISVFYHSWYYILSTSISSVKWIMPTSSETYQNLKYLNIKAVYWTINSVNLRHLFICKSRSKVIDPPKVIKPLMIRGPTHHFLLQSALLKTHYCNI